MHGGQSLDGPMQGRPVGGPREEGSCRENRKGTDARDTAKVDRAALGNDVGMKGKNVWERGQEQGPGLCPL